MLLGARDRLEAALGAALSDALTGLELAPKARVALRNRARDFVLDLPADDHLPVELFAADALCALVGDGDVPDLVLPAVLVVHQILARALIDSPPAIAFAPLRPLLIPGPVDAPAVRRWFGEICRRYLVAQSYR